MVVRKFIVIFLMFLASNLVAKENRVRHYSPPVNEILPREVFWGDTHVHTNLSTDAYNFGNLNLGPEEAYRFAKGRGVTANNGMTVKLHRPLDFLVIADHIENLAVMQGLAKDASNLQSTISGKQWAKTSKIIDQLRMSDPARSVELSLSLFISTLFGDEVIVKGNYLKSLWKEQVELADLNNDPGKFTAFSGYEWTASRTAGIHRVVIFKDPADKVTQVIPFSRFDSSDPENLWSYFDNYEKETGGEVLAIPHNSNISGGVMFALETASGDSISKNYALRRSRWEPLVEVTQIKGDSETHPLLSPQDEFSSFERLEPSTSNANREGDYANWLKALAEHSGDLKANSIQYDYVRSALKLGLAEKNKIGANPFKFGVIGSTDSHTSLATADENNFWGKMTFVEPYKNRIRYGWNGPYTKKDRPDPWSKAWKMNAAGYAAVWAEENSRESLFSAMKRKEVYASTGPRITVRFFGGWDYQSNDAYRPDLARIGYEKGVPMGGDLTSAPKDKSPKFLIRAVKDPDGANLDRVQVIKGWHDAKGQLHEEIYNVALSDNREDKGSTTKRVGNTVDIPDASYTNTIGDPELAVVWRDPDFDKDELAFYYLRVLEIPTPRWTAYDAKYFQLTDIPEEIPMITQERAYTSPIWYTPSN